MIASSSTREPAHSSRRASSGESMNCFRLHSTTQVHNKAASGGNKSSSKTKMVRHGMEKGDTFIVKSLSFPNEEEAADGDSHLVCATAFSSLPTIRVGLGPTDAGSNFPKVVLEITRVPMNLCITRV